MADDEIVRVKGELSATGGAVDFRLGKGVPEFLARTFPRWAARRDATTAVSSRILAAIQQHDSLDEADVEYASAVLGEAEAKWIRRRAIAQRAVLALPEATGPQTAATEDAQPSGGPQPQPDADWLNQFWEDAGLVSDEAMQELYGRILLSQARKPGACSRRTLAVVRSLDRETAEVFQRIARVTVSSWVPKDTEVLRSLGLNLAAILDLGDAGLLDSDSMLAVTIDSDDNQLYRWNDRAILIRNAKSSRLGIHPLSRAGRELLTVADVPYEPIDFTTVIAWLNRNLKKGRTLGWALLPHRNWEGDGSKLHWNEVPPVAG